jgi:hypothetical protein
MEKFRILVVSLIFSFSSYSMISRKAFGSSARRFNSNVTNVILRKVHNPNTRRFNGRIVGVMSGDRRAQVVLVNGKVISVTYEEEFGKYLQNAQSVWLAFDREDCFFENGKIIGHVLNNPLE